MSNQVPRPPEPSVGRFRRFQVVERAGARGVVWDESAMSEEVQVFFAPDFMDGEAQAHCPSAECKAVGMMWDIYPEETAFYNARRESR